MRKNGEMLNAFPCHKIDNKAFIPLVESILKKISVAISIVAGNRDFLVFIHKLGASQTEADQNNIKIQMAYAEGRPSFPKKIDVVGTLLVQIVSANLDGGDYINWCRYYSAKSTDAFSLKAYEKIMAIDIFFRSILTEEEYEKFIEDCKKNGVA